MALTLSIVLFFSGLLFLISQWIIFIRDLFKKKPEKPKPQPKWGRDENNLK